MQVEEELVDEKRLNFMSKSVCSVRRLSVQCFSAKVTGNIG